MNVLSNLLGLSGLLVPVLALVALGLLLLALGAAWREAAAEKAPIAAFGDHGELRLQLTPLLLTAGVLAAVWPLGAFGLVAPLVDYSLGWHHARAEGARPPSMPGEGHLGLTAVQVVVLTGLGVAIGDAASRLLGVMDLAEGWPLAGLLGLIGLVWAVQRASVGAPPLLRWVTLLILALGWEPEPTQAPARAASRERAREEAARAEERAAAARAARPVTDDSEDARRLEAQRLAAAAIERELRAMRREAAEQPAVAVPTPPAAPPDAPVAPEVEVVDDEEDEATAP